MAPVKDGVLTFSALGNFFGNGGHPPAAGETVLVLTVPLREGLAAGSYPAS
ncbi:MAG TPA: hypothetical protein VFD71_03080 [Planctomycetota bacterium]|nr:hypothetical protein [Planctomycetota bacterium]